MPDRTKRIAISRIEPEWGEFEPPDLSVGKYYYLVSAWYGPGSHGRFSAGMVDRSRHRFQLRRSPARTNTSGEERIKGWLGTTDNIDRNACGLWKIVDGGDDRHVLLEEGEAR
jgi:hypothetical protein